MSRLMSRLAIVIAILGFTLPVYAANQPSEDTRPELLLDYTVVDSVFAGTDGVFVLIDVDSGKVFMYGGERCRQRLAPCSTFKIWNTLIGLEEGFISTADDPFYRWDGQRRSIEAWNHDLTLKEAFQASCVPAYQALARKIGKPRMEMWLNRIGFNDPAISAQIDQFWLPAKGRNTVLVSPYEQAEMLERLTTGQLPFSERSRAVLTEIMHGTDGQHGSLYGKTGSGTDEKGVGNLGWYVGWLTSAGRTYTFACMIQTTGASGVKARELSTDVFSRLKML